MAQPATPVAMGACRASLLTQEPRGSVALPRPLREPAAPLAVAERRQARAQTRAPRARLALAQVGWQQPLEAQARAQTRAPRARLAAAQVGWQQPLEAQARAQAVAEPEPQAPAG